MRTLQEHLDDLDRMVDSGSAPKHEIRSQIAFIGREVAALEANYLRLTDDHAKSNEAATKRIAELDAKIAAIISENATPVENRPYRQTRREKLERAGL